MNKAETVVGFISDLAAWKAKVKDDSRLLLSKLPLAALADEVLLSDFLMEFSEALIRKHLISENGRITPEAAAMIRRYVEGMSGKKMQGGTRK